MQPFKSTFILPSTLCGFNLPFLIRFQSNKHTAVRWVVRACVGAYNPIPPPEKGNVNSRFLPAPLAKSFPRWFWLTALSSIPDGFHIWAMAEALRQAKMTDRRQQRRGLGAAQKFANSFHIFPAVETLFFALICVWNIWKHIVYILLTYIYYINTSIEVSCTQKRHIVASAMLKVFQFEPL